MQKIGGVWEKRQGNFLGAEDVLIASKARRVAGAPAVEGEGLTSEGREVAVRREEEAIGWVRMGE